MNGKNKFAVPVAVALTILGYVFLYFFFSGNIRWIDTISKLKSINFKRYTVTVELSVNENLLLSSLAERENLLKKVNEVLLKRIDKFGSEIEQKTLNANTGTLSYTISDVEVPTDAVWLLSQQGKIGFYKTFETSEVLNYLAQVNQALAEIILKQQSNAPETNKQETNPSVGDELFADFAPDSTAKQRISEQTKQENISPLFQLLYPNIISDPFKSNATMGEGPMVGRAMIKDTSQINSYLSLPEVKTLLPPDLILMWGATPIDNEKKVLGLYAIQQPYQVAEPPITGEYIQDAYVNSTNDVPEIDFTFDVAGASKWSRITRDASNALVGDKYVKKCIAIVVDNKVYSAPRVQQEITGGKCQITSVEKLNEAHNLVNIMNSGELPVTVAIKNVTIK